MHYYLIRRTDMPPDLASDEGPWTLAETARVDQFRDESSDHRPRTRVRLLHDGATLYGLFTVEDRYVRCVTTALHGPVCKDSCVEFFFQPRPEKGYFNFEFNAGGCLCASYNEDPSFAPVPERLCRPLTPAEAGQVRIAHSLPAVIEPEIQTPLSWRLGFALPLSLLAADVPGLADPGGACWRGNFYKCGTHTSHPHWASWAPLDKKNFHLPRCFGTLHFER